MIHRLYCLYLNPLFKKKWNGIIKDVEQFVTPNMFIFGISTSSNIRKIDLYLREILLQTIGMNFGWIRIFFSKTYVLI